MSKDALVAHSLAEAYLYLMATPCGSCGKGPLRGSGGEWHAGARVDASARSTTLSSERPPAAEGARSPGDEWIVSVTASCDACQAADTHLFRLPEGPGSYAFDEWPVVNPTDEPSRIIDVAQWITLFRMLTEAGDRETEKTKTRHLNIEAAQCLEEALKFYDEVGNDLPPREAFFQDASRRRLKDSPEQFSRQRLMDLRAKLPIPSTFARRGGVAPTGSDAADSKRRWWRRRR